MEIKPEIASSTTSNCYSKSSFNLLYLDIDIALKLRIDIMTQIVFSNSFAASSYILPKTHFTIKYTPLTMIVIRKSKVK